MADQPQQVPPPRVADPDNVPETLCDGQFNLTITGPLATITFTHVRPQADPLFAGSLSPESIVRARIVTPIPNLIALRDLLNTMLQAVNTDTAAPAPATGGTTRH
jgi:hypothetical protein